MQGPVRTRDPRRASVPYLVAMALLVAVVPIVSIDTDRTSTDCGDSRCAMQLAESNAAACAASDGERGGARRIEVAPPACCVASNGSTSDSRAGATTCDRVRDVTLGGPR